MTIHTQFDDAARAEAKLRTALTRAFAAGELTCLSDFLRICEAVPEARTLETAEVERIVWHMVNEAIETGPVVAVIVGGSANVWLAQPLKRSKGGRLGAARKAAKAELTKALRASEAVQEAAVFDVFLLPDEGLSLEHYQQRPFHLIRARGRSLGCLLYDKNNNSWSASDEVNPDYDNVWYRIERDIYLADRMLDLNVRTWPTRRILRYLDRLVTEHIWIDDLGLLFPTYSYQSECCASSSPFVQALIKRHCTVTDRIWVAIFVLCLEMIDRREDDLLTDDELNLARFTDDIDPERFPEVPEPIRRRWDDLNRIIADRIYDRERAQ